MLSCMQSYIHVLLALHVESFGCLGFDAGAVGCRLVYGVYGATG